MSLIQDLFSDTTEEQQEAMLNRLLSTSTRKSSLLKTEILHDVLTLLDGDDDAKLFSDLKAKVDDAWRSDLVISRVGKERNAAEASTPVVVKDLKPPGPKICLCWQVSASAFEGYYPRPEADIAKAQANKKRPGDRVKTHFTTSKKYEGARSSNVSQLDALEHVVKFLWAQHKKQGHVTLV